MISRIWHGWTTHENADKYENLLRNEIFPLIESKKIKGYRKISLLKSVLEEEVEFITIMIFDNLEAVKEFVGDDHERAHVPDSARKVLLRYDERSQHYEMINEIIY